MFARTAAGKVIGSVSGKGKGATNATAPEKPNNLNFPIGTIWNYFYLCAAFKHLDLINRQF